MPDPNEPKNDPPSQTTNSDLMNRGAILGFGTYFIVVGLLLFYLVFVAWPPDFQAIGGGKDGARDPVSPVVFADYSRAVPTPAGGPAAREVREVFQRRFDITYDQRLLLLVFVLGALGSYVHVVTSFADYVGNRRLVKSWTWWYLLRPFIGAPTAVVFYFAVRAGFMSANSTGGDVNRFGIAAVAMLVGMFSMKATDKLEEVFDVLFKSPNKRKDQLGETLDVLFKTPDKGKEALVNGPPMLSGTMPPSVKAGSPALTLTLSGANFSPRAVVLVNGEPRTPEKATTTALEIVLTAKELSKKKTIKLAVRNPPPTNALSAEWEFTVEK